MDLKVPHYAIFPIPSKWFPNYGYLPQYFVFTYFHMLLLEHKRTLMWISSRLLGHMDMDSAATTSELHLVSQLVS
jgi:hypothetical protein